MSEDRVRRTMAIAERLRQRHPDARASCLIYFTGMVSDLLAQRDPAHGLVAHLLDRVREGVVEIGYDGAEEPTYWMRPQPNFRKARSAQDRWLARGEVASWFLNEYKHFMTGEPDPSRPGGLKKTHEVFRDAAAVRGYSLDLGGDAEWLHHIRRFTATAILPGFAEGHTWPARTLHGYGGSVMGLSQLLSPEAHMAPELFWQENALRLSDTSGPAVRVVALSEGREALQAVLDKLDRNRPHVLSLRVADHRHYLKPETEKAALENPIRWAYDHPKSPVLPEAGMRPVQEVDAAFARDAATLEWLAGDYFPANPGSRFVSAADLRRMAATTLGSQVSRARLAELASALLEDWKVQGNHPPNFARAGGDYYSLADMFLLLSASLAEWRRTGALPDSVRLTHVYGPMQTTGEQGPPQGSVSVEAIAETCARLAPGLQNETWTPLPENVVPEWVEVGSLRLNAAQFLRLMAEAYASGDRAARLAVRTSVLFSEMAEAMPNTRGSFERGVARAQRTFVTSTVTHR